MKKGFTLIELLVVITILSILMVVLISNVTGGTAEAKKLGCKNNLTKINGQLTLYQSDPPFSMPYPGDGGLEPDPVGMHFFTRLFNTGKLQSKDGTINGVDILKCPFNPTRVPGYNGPLQNINDKLTYKDDFPIAGDIVLNDESNHPGEISKDGIYALLKNGTVVDIRKGEKKWDAFIKLVGMGAETKTGKEEPSK
ncbi:MAG: type II secretion system protein [Planctomycetes bacterium]|nr:type II secretion system protein [Planctomycetota bacterium]